MKKMFEKNLDKDSVLALRKERKDRRKEKVNKARERAEKILAQVIKNTKETFGTEELEIPFDFEINGNILKSLYNPSSRYNRIYCQQDNPVRFSKLGGIVNLKEDDRFIEFHYKGKDWKRFKFHHAIVEEKEEVVVVLNCRNCELPITTIDNPYGANWQPVQDYLILLNSKVKLKQ